MSLGVLYKSDNQGTMLIYTSKHNRYNTPGSEIFLMSRGKETRKNVFLISLFDVIISKQICNRGGASGNILGKISK